VFSLDHDFRFCDGTTGDSSIPRARLDADLDRG
jgi:hypothetical protein